MADIMFVYLCLSKYDCMKLYIFNPDADMALASQEENYMAPAPIRCMAADMAVLPVWYAAASSLVLAPSAYNLDFIKKMQALFSLPVQMVTEVELAEYSHASPVPWGWNAALRKRLLKDGIADSRLPSVSWLEKYRRLASRQNAVEVLSSFEKTEGCVGRSHWLTALDDCGRVAAGMDGKCVFKAPWSGSGKGLHWCHQGFTAAAQRWCGHVLEKQGGIVAEPVYNKVLDFAMEFYSSGEGEVVFIGYSLFETNNRGAYQRNLLMPAEAIERSITEFVSLPTLIRVRERLQLELQARYGHDYSGCLGVDMMVCRDDDGSFSIHPCVEINLRMNMGIVSLTFFQQFMHPSSTGYLSVCYYPSSEELHAQHAADAEACPPEVRDGRLLSGYLPLVPVTPKSHYRVFVMAVSPEAAPVG